MNKGTPPPQEQRDHTKTFMLTLDAEQHQALRATAFKKRQSMRDVLRDLIREHVQEEPAPTGEDRV